MQRKEERVCLCVLYEGNNRVTAEAKRTPGTEPQYITQNSQNTVINNTKYSVCVCVYV